MELRHIQEMQELRSSLEKQDYFTFSQAARLMGVSRQYIYKTGQGGKTEGIPNQRKDGSGETC